MRYFLSVRMKRARATSVANLSFLSLAAFPPSAILLPPTIVRRSRPQRHACASLNWPVHALITRRSKFTRKHPARAGRGVLLPLPQEQRQRRGVVGQQRGRRRSAPLPRLHPRLLREPCRLRPRARRCWRRRRGDATRRTGIVIASRYERPVGAGGGAGSRRRGGRSRHSRRRGPRGTTGGFRAAAIVGGEVDAVLTRRAGRRGDVVQLPPFVHV